MMNRVALALAPMTLIGLAACEPVPGGTTSTSPGFAPLPESVTSIAAPYQDLSTARYVPEDGCYWYAHVGPVETTLLPLRTSGGNRICTRVETAEG